MLDENTTKSADMIAPLETVEEPPALPEAPHTEPPRPLVPGAFLRFEYEIKTVLVRGLTNLYLAEGGDFGLTTPKLIAERAATSDSAPNSEGEEAVTPLYSSRLFPPREAFAQDEREYLIFDYIESEALQDHREPTNDERYCQLLGDLVVGLRELEERGLQAELDRELLRVGADGGLYYFGFLDVRPDVVDEEVAHEVLDPLAQLREMNSFLLRHTFAQSSTLRLDDEVASLALSEEVKALARGIGEGAFETLAEIDELLARFNATLGPTVTAALLSDVGQQRELNEDAGLVVRLERAAHLGTYTIDLYAVADGMGGHEGGEVASHLTLNALQRAIADQPKLNWDDNLAVRGFLMEVIDRVNRAVVTMNEAPPYSGMRAKPGSTLVFAVRVGARVFVGNVGDSRAYKWREGQGLERITKDHSYVQSLVDSGDLAEEDAWDHPDGSIITAHIGEPRLRTRDLFLRLLTPGDKLLLVSDGVVDMLRDRDIEPHLHAAAPAAVCRGLVDAANEAGGMDNITVVCVAVN